MITSSEFRVFCEFCGTGVREYMRFCPKCRIRLDESQRDLARANILLTEVGSWRKSGEVPEESAEKLLARYRSEHESVVSLLASRSPLFRGDAIPTAQIAAIAEAAPPVAAVAAKPAEAAEAPVVVMKAGGGGEVTAEAPRAVFEEVRTVGGPAAERVWGILTEAHLNWIANAGIFAVFTALVLLVKDHWSGMEPIVRVGLLAASAAGAMGLGGVLRAKTILRTTGTSVFVLGALAVPVIFWLASWSGAVEMPGASVGLAGSVVCAGLYAAIGRAAGMRWFNELAMVSALFGQGFLMWMCEVGFPDLAAGYAVTGAVLAGARAWRVSFDPTGRVTRAVMIGASFGMVPVVLGGAEEAAVVGLLALLAGYAILSNRAAGWSVGALMALAVLGLYARGGLGCGWEAWAPLMAAFGALPMGLSLWKREDGRVPFLTAGAVVMFAMALVIAASGYDRRLPEADSALFGAAVIVSAACAAAAWRRDETAWALAALVVPGAAAFALRRMLGIDGWWAPVGIAVYAQVLVAIAGPRNVFSRVAAPVALLAQAASVLALVDVTTWKGHSPDAHAWRAALTLALPGLAQVAFGARKNTAWLYPGVTALLLALVPALHAIDVPVAWLPFSVGVAALAASIAARGTWSGPVRSVALVAVLPAFFAGVLAWARPESPASFAVAAALVLFAGPGWKVPTSAGVASALLSTAWLSSACALFPAPWSFVAGTVPWLVAVGLARFLHRERARAVVALTGVISAGVLWTIATGPISILDSAGAGPAAVSFGVTAVAALWMGLRRQAPETWSGLGAALALFAGLLVVRFLRVPQDWTPLSAAALPAAFVALGSHAWFLPQGRPWAGAGALGLVACLAIGLFAGPLPFATVCLVAAAAALTALRFAPAAAPGVASFLFNAAFFAFLLHLRVPPSLAAPMLMVAAIAEAFAGTLAGRHGAGHALFASAASLAAAALAFSFFPDAPGAAPTLGPALVCLGAFAVAAGALSALRRQNYLAAVALAAAACEYLLALRHFHVATLEAYTFAPVAAFLAWGYAAARREVFLVEGTAGTVLEARLSASARELAAGVREQLAMLRPLAIVAALAPTGLLAVSGGEGRLAWALVGSAVAMVAGIVFRKKRDAVAGTVVLCGVIGVKAAQWLLERELSAAWWILIVGTTMLGAVALFELRRSWYLKGKGEGVRKLVDACMGKWE